MKEDVERKTILRIVVEIERKTSASDNEGMKE